MDKSPTPALYHQKKQSDILDVSLFPGTRLEVQQDEDHSKLLLNPLWDNLENGDKDNGLLLVLGL